MLTLFSQHQAQVLTIMDQAEPILRTGGPADAPTLGRLRWELLRALGAYELFKHCELFDRAIAAGSPADAALARQMKADCLAMKDQFRAYVARWSRCSVAAEWQTYQPAALAMGRRLRDHLGRERAGATRLCASGGSGVRRRAAASIAR